MDKAIHHRKAKIGQHEPLNSKVNSGTPVRNALHAPLMAPVVFILLLLPQPHHVNQGEQHI
jgi:hypothetical protein